MMHSSIFDRVQRNSMRMSIYGGVALGMLTIINFEPLTATGLAVLGPWGIVNELIGHIVLPLVVVLVPVAFASMKLLRVEFETLDQAAQRIDAATQQVRGTRVATDGLPIEILPFAYAVNRLLERRDRAAEQSEAFAADVAHELKTPLAILSLELERQDPAFAASVRQELRSIDRLIDQLLILAQLDAYVAAPQPLEDVDLLHIARDVIAAIAPGALQQRITITFGADGDAVAHGRSEILRAALRNLVENAVRVTPAGGTVVVTAGPGPIISVRDEGPGLSEEQLRQLSERFSRADHASLGGAGLGLSIVARVAAIHHGRFWSDQESRSLNISF